ncbi:MAG: CPBP family intramembrane metalloprotease [Proteobacteria bacterium]|nr:CPBP family intramembrane metalloprotease [Pseudomonadota bacterium]
MNKNTSIRATMVGLAIALFAGPIFLAAYRAIGGESRSDGQVMMRELGVLLIVALLLWLIKSWESLPLGSIGLQADRVGRSALRGGLLALLLLVVTVGLYFLLRGLGIHLGKESPGAFHPSLPVVAFIMLRAGIAEEICYRGYAIERLQGLTGKAWLAGLLPLLVFAIAHYRQGMGGIIAAFVLGGIMTIFYMRYRDLVANIVGHSVADLVLNVGLPLAGAG